jgi:ADP-ribose pyrophosphatase YjhB (NUDIX family)
VRARFCDACGASLHEPPPTSCSRCGAEHWLNAKPCANALVLDGDRVLLIRRAHAPWCGRWCAPGGFCEEAEHPVAAAEREILEETGVHARVTGFLGIWLDRYADDRADEDAEMISVAYYLARPVDGEPSGRDCEASEVAWFALDDVPSDLAPPGTLEQIVAVARRAVENGTTTTPLPDAPRAR